MLHDSIQRLASQRATCKQCGVILGVAILLAGGLGRLGAVNILWATAPLLLLGLADAGYAAEQRRCAELLKDQKGNKELSAPLPDTADGSIRHTIIAMLSPSILPFYFGLLALLSAGAFFMPVKQIPAQVATVTAATPMPLQYMQQIPGGGTPFPMHLPMNPAQRNGPPIPWPPHAPITHPVNRGTPQATLPAAPSTPFGSTPAGVH